VFVREPSETIVNPYSPRSLICFASWAFESLLRRLSEQRAANLLRTPGEGGA
jgi:hypothetical protein